MDKISAFEIGVAAGMEKAAVSTAALSYLGLQGLGGLVGHHYGGEQKKRGEKYKFGVGQAVSLLLPGGVGYQIGRNLAHKKDK